MRVVRGQVVVRRRRRLPVQVQFKASICSGPQHTAAAAAAGRPRPVAMVVVVMVVMMQPARRAANSQHHIQTKR